MTVVTGAGARTFVKSVRNGHHHGGVEPLNSLQVPWDLSHD